MSGCEEQQTGHADGAATLHLVQRAEVGALDACRAFCTKGDTVVLVDRGVLALCDNGWRSGFPPGIEFGCVHADLLAHGLGREAGSPGIRVLDESGLVRLVMDCRHCLSWK